MSKSKAYASLVMVEDLNVPPIEEQKAEQAAAPKQEAIQLVPANGRDIRAPISKWLSDWSRGVYM